MKDVKVTFDDTRGSISFLVICFRDGVEEHRAICRQDEVGVVCRRYMYIHTNPFPGPGNIGGRVWEKE